MKIQYPENEALFGTDHDGEKRWYCWRLPHGCRGKLGSLKTSSHGTLQTHSELEITRSFHFERGAWRTNRRGTLRSKNNIFLRAVVKIAKKEGRLDEVAEIHEVLEVTPAYTFETKRDESLLFPPKFVLPTKIECPACGAMNRIPALQGAIKVRAGAVLPTCTDKRA